MEEESETPPIDPSHPDDGIEQIPTQELDFGGGPVEADASGIDNLLPAVTNDTAIVGD